MVGGVAAGIADEIGVDPVVVRIAFVVLAVAGGWGVALYALAWAVLVVFEPPPDRPYEPVPKATSEQARLVGVGLVVFGLLLSSRQLGGFVGDLVWPVAVLGAGLAVANQRGVVVVGGGTDDDERTNGSLVRIGAGLVLVVAAVVLAITLNFDLTVVRDTLLASAVAVAGVALVLGPWLLQTVRELGEERRRRIRSDERAEMAAHLHDSVLQTLALIQRRSEDPEVVVLARRQERELRAWLFSDGPTSGPATAGFRARLAAELADAEAREGVPVELVVVGDDVTVDARIEALVGAAKEAATNAARHGGVHRVDVFAEVFPEAIDVYVRDTGQGFDPAGVSSDRRGLAESVVGRMRRCGGSAIVVSRPGAGTEVELHLPREDQ